jgi:hypothetical protein
MMNLFAVSAVNCLVVIIVVLIHYEFLYRMTRLLPTLSIKHRYRILVGVAGSLIAHVVEIWVFALAYFIMIGTLGWGSFSGHFEGSLLDCFYFSFTTYTTLGFGDIQPFGEVRYLTGIESLSGLLLITWTASFLYLEMQKFWDGE